MTRRECLSPADLAFHVREELPPDRVASVEEHIAGCDRCRDRVALLRRIVEAGARPIETVLQDAARLVDDILSEPEHRWALLVREPQFRSVGIGRRLLAFALDERSRSSRRAIAASSAAVALADLLEDADSDLADFRFDAWKSHSALLREGGRFAESEDALMRAAEAAESASEPLLARASVLLARALLCAEPDIWEPNRGIALLDEAEPIFASHDRERFRRARTVRAMILLRAGDGSRAQVVFEEVLAATPESDEAAWADAAANAARANVDVDDLTRAEELLVRAEAIDRRRDAKVNLAHDLTTRARIHGRRLDFAAMSATALDAMHAFDKLGLPLSCVRAGLLALQALIALGRSAEAYDLALDLCERSVALDRRIPASRHLRTAEALMYLRDLSLRQELTADVVAMVGSYVDEIAEKPPFPFRPPFELTTN